MSLVAASHEELAEGGEGCHDDADLCGHDLPVRRPRHVNLVVVAHTRGSDDRDDDHDDGQAERACQCQLLSPLDSDLPNKSGRNEDNYRRFL